MAKNPQEIRIGDVDVYLDLHDGAGEQNLGYTKGGVTFTFEREFQDLTVDEFGSSPLDKALTGNKVMIKTLLAQPSNVNLAYAIPEGLSAHTALDSKVGLGAKAGKLLSVYAGQLRLHPRANTPANRNEDVYIWKAVSTENIELAYKIDDQKILEVTFEGLVDTTQPDGQLLGRVGDEAIS